jgi:hypothetical protein
MTTRFLLRHLLFQVILIYAFIFSFDSVGHPHDNHNVVFHELSDPITGLRLTVRLSKSYVQRGNDQLIPGKSIHGAIILSEFAMPKASKNLSSWTNEQLETAKKVSARLQNYRDLQAELPFNLTRWSGIVALPCPYFRNGHKTERGLQFAHYRIWKDFAYFPPRLIAKYNATKEYTASKDGMYVIHANSTMEKDGTLFSAEDILVVFEDDALSVVNDLSTTIAEELGQMNMVDLLFLGWCEGRAARPFPLCAHAYAITRASAIKLLHYYEPCGRAVDEQFVIMLKNGWLQHRRAFPHSYKVLKAGAGGGDRTSGIFRQAKGNMGSINAPRRKKV